MLLRQSNHNWLSLSFCIRMTDIALKVKTQFTLTSSIDSTHLSQLRGCHPDDVHNEQNEHTKCQPLGMR